MDALSAYIRETAGEPWVYGWSDCLPWVLRWTMQATGRRAFVPPYHDRRGAVRVIRLAGGVLPLVALYARRLALAPTNDPQRGDVGVIVSPRALTGKTGAICTGSGTWAGKDHLGRVSVFRAGCIAAWSITDRAIG